MTTVITICDTCKREDWASKGVEETDGVHLARLIETKAESIEGVETRRHSCLMKCNGSCNVAIQSDDKVTYMMTEFEAGEEAADAIVEMARLHMQSRSGMVPLKVRPEALKGHFNGRLPTLNKPG